MARAPSPIAVRDAAPASIPVSQNPGGSPPSIDPPADAAVAPPACAAVSPPSGTPLGVLTHWRLPFAPSAVTAPVRAVAAAAPLPPRRAQQLHLDLGQRAFDTAQCPLCGMVYCPGNAADERLHGARCGVGDCGGGAPVDGGAAPQWAALVRGAVEVDGSGGGGGVRVMHLPPRPPSAPHSGGAVAVAEFLARMLGPDSAPPPPPAPAPHYFLALGTGGALAGVACVHALAPPVARLLRAGGGVGGCSGGGVVGGSALVLRADAPRVRATLGVAQVWVAAGARRRGLARRLLDTARARAIYAYHVPRCELAFSSPTGDGFALALAYGTRSAVAVYGGEHAAIA